MKTRIVVVRHGETEWNAAGRIQGQADSALTPMGILQAEAIASRLEAEPMDGLVSSDLARAWKTALAIGVRAGHRVRRDRRLRERSYGAAEGLSYDVAREQYPAAFAREQATDPDYAVPGGESRRQLQERVRETFEALASEWIGRRLVVVCHGGVLATLYRYVNGIPVEQFHPVPIPNAAYNVLLVERGRWKIENWADTAHLDWSGTELAL